MLPGFRFLFVATVMSISVMVFGLGAAALLRATHETFATFPQRRPPEQVFVKVDTSTPVIAMLRVEPEPQATAPPASAPPRDESPAIENKAEIAAGPVAQAPEPVTIVTDATASAPVKDEPVPAPPAAPNSPEPAPPAAPQLDATRATETLAAETAPAVVAPTPEITASAQPTRDPAATTGTVKIAALSDGGDAISRLADARKKAEAAKARMRDLEAARRARAAKVAAQRRRIAAIRAREARQKQQQEQQQPFAPLFN